MKTNEEIYDLTLSSINQLANIKNWCEVLDMYLPDFEVGRKTKSTKESVLNSIKSSVKTLLENNAELQKYIKEKDRMENNLM